MDNKDKALCTVDNKNEENFEIHATKLDLLSSHQENNGTIVDDISLDENERSDPFQFDDYIIDPTYMPRSSEDIRVAQSLVVLNYKN